MDGSRFDDLTKALAGRASRRSAMRGALAAIVAGTGLRGGAALATSRCNVSWGQSPCGSHCCNAGTVCCGGRCLTPQDFQTDRTNCGGCGNTCPTGATCVGGACQCRRGTTVCDGACVNLQADQDNCGACGDSCGEEQRCEGGVCTCLDGSETACGSICVDLDRDPSNCGSCGAECATDDGEICCDGACVDALNDLDHCGACGRVCGLGQFCESGVCQAQPPTLGCSADSACGDACPQSGSGSCRCGTTMTGDPVCYSGSNGCAGHPCETRADCRDLGLASECILGFCSTPSVYCTTDADCAAGLACVDLNDGCGGCDNFTGSVKGICNPVCTS